MPIYGYKRNGRVSGTILCAAPSMGSLSHPRAGLPTDSSSACRRSTCPCRPGLDGAVWGAVLFGVFFGWLTAVIGMLLATGRHE